MTEVFKNIDIAITMMPLLIGAIVLELLVGIWKGANVYHFKDTLANVATGLLIALPGFLSKAVAYGLYSFAYQFSFFKFGNGWWVFVLCFLGSDLIYYLFHLLGHKTQLFWAGHLTHHSSKHFNLSIAIRFPFQVIYRFIFWTPLALLGFNPSMIILTDSIVFVYAFYLHTQLVGKLGPIEWLFNTPSHHRVHHSSNKGYLDTNYGGVFIIWDRLFRTFKKETEQPIYGITDPVKTFNPFKLQFDEYIYTFKEAFRSQSLFQAMKFLLGKPTEHNNTTPPYPIHDCNNCNLICPFKNLIEEEWVNGIVRKMGVKEKAA